MKYVVAVKQVPDTTMISTDENGNLIRAGVPSILDPYCEYAMDLVRRIRTDNDTAIVVTMGPLQAKEVLLRCLDLGADDAYLLSDRAFAGADTFATAKTLSAFVKKIAPDYDIIFCGKQAADGDTAQVPSELAEMMCAPQYCYVTNMDIGSETLTQDYGDEIRKCKISRPCVISVSEGDTNRALPSISDHLSAVSKEIHILDRIALGLGAFSVGNKGSKTKIIRFYSPRSEHTCVIKDGSDPKKASQMILEALK